LQKERVYHSDLKPANILVFTEGDLHRAAICDFGHSNMNFTAETTPILVSTPAYQAPEVFLAIYGLHPAIGNVGYATMVWSFGCILYFLYKKQNPFPIKKADDRQTVIEKLTTGSSIIEKEALLLKQNYPSLTLQVRRRQLVLADKEADLLLKNAYSSPYNKWQS
jgi:serine/threonine protein kinase